MSLFDSAFATAKTLAKELGNGGIPAVHCGGKICGDGFEASCNRSIRGCDPLVLCSWEEVNYKGTDTPNELGFITDPSYRYDIHAVHLHGYPTQKAEAITLHSDDLGTLAKILRNCRERVEESIMKNKKAKTVAEGHGSELLTVIDAVELADEITKAGRLFYIDTDSEVENGLDVWAVNSKTGDDYPRSWRVMNDLSALIFNTDRNGNSDLVDEKSFENLHALGAWLAKEFNNLAGKNESDEWDDDQYKEWALDDISPLIDGCWASIESAVKEKYPGATLTANNDAEVEDISAQRGRDWSNTTVSLKETGKLAVPVEYDPLEDSPAIDSAVGRDINSITSILGGIKFNTRRASIRQKGNLMNPEVSFSDADFERKAIVIPLTLTYTYHYEDSAY